MTKKTAVTTTTNEPKALIGLDPTDLIKDAEQDSHFGKDDLAISFLKVLQKGSPEVNKRDAAYVAGAEVGDFLNSVTGTRYNGDEGVIVVPVHFEQSFIEWRLLEQGGGMVRDHGTDGSLMEKCTRDSKGRDVTPAGNQLVKSALYYVLVVNPETGTFEPAAFTLKSTQLKKSRKWNSLMMSLRINVNGTELRPPMFYMSYQLNTVQESNEQGDWMGVKIGPFKPTVELPNGVELYMQAREFRTMVQSGMAKVTPQSETLDDDAF